MVNPEKTTKASEVKRTEASGPDETKSGGRMRPEKAPTSGPSLSATS